MLITRENITKVLPHRNPLIMIDNLSGYEDEHFISDFNIRPDNIFVKNGLLSEGGIIENIAQTSAAGANLYCLENNIQTKLVFIASISNVVIHGYPKVGDTLITKSKITARILNYILVNGYSYCNGNLIAECEIRNVVDSSNLK